MYAIGLTCTCVMATLTRSEQLGQFQAVATTARQTGFPLTQFVTHMEWALENAPGVENLLEYEARANARWMGREGPFNPVICVYDLTKFSGAIVVDVMRTHPLVIIGGVLQENPHFLPPDEFLRQRREWRPARKQSKIEAGESQLRASINDLVSVMALPAIWSGSAAPRIFEILLEVLTSMLHLEFAYATFSGNSDDQPRERSGQPWRGQHLPRTKSARRLSLSEARAPEPYQIRWAAAKSPWHRCAWANMTQSDGYFSDHPGRDFPSSIERLLMNVAVNQAAIGLQEVRILGDQKRVAAELDVKVALRTRELGDAHQRLQRAFGEIRGIEGPTCSAKMSCSVRKWIRLPCTRKLSAAIRCCRQC